MRIGLALWVISYVPFPVALAWLFEKIGVLSGAKSERNFILIMWACQYAIGLLGLYIAGREAISLVRDQGWRKLPRNIWCVLLGRPAG